MRALYLTGDTRIRASAFSLFLPLYIELERTGKVDIKEVNAFSLYGDDYKKKIFKGKRVDIDRQFNSGYLNDNYDIIVLENPFPYWNEDWDGIKAKKVLILGDLHRFNPKGKYPHFMSNVRDRIGLSSVFSKYIETYRRDFDSIKLPVYHWPHSVSPNIFYDYKLEKVYDVLLTGMISECVYPKRYNAYNCLKNKKYFKRIDRPKNRMDKFPNPWPVGVEYAKELNKSRISVACTSIYHYTIAKIFEIPACNSVLLCDYTEEMMSLGFVPQKNFLEIPKNKESLVEYVEDMLHSQKLKQISRNGYKMIHERHTTEHRVKEFMEYCRRVLQQ